MDLGTVSSKLQAENYHFVKGNTTHLGQLQSLQQKRISTFVQLTTISSHSRTKKMMFLIQESSYTCHIHFTSILYFL
jgi:hypothetical protein